MKAMVLAAGYGTRLGSLTRDIPKPMLDIDGRPILEIILRHLSRHGFDDIIVNLHFRPAMIRDYFGDGRRFGVRLTYSFEESLLGTAGGLKNVASFFEGAGNFLVQYGDVVTDEDLTAMLRFHEERRAIATLLLHKRVQSNSVVTLSAEGRIDRFLERPDDEMRRSVDPSASSWVHSGICIATQDLLDRIPLGVTSDLPRDVYAPLVREGAPLYGWPLHGYRCAIDSPQRLDEARRRFCGLREMAER